MTKTVAAKPKPLTTRGATLNDIETLIREADPEAMALLGPDPLRVKHELRRVVARTRVIFFEDTLLGAFVTVPHGTQATELMALPTIHAKEHKTALVKAAKAIIAEARAQVRGSLVMTVAPGSERDRKFAELLGFKPGFHEDQRLVMVWGG